MQILGLIVIGIVIGILAERSPVTSPTTVGPADLTNTVSFTIVIP